MLDFRRNSDQRRKQIRKEHRRTLVMLLLLGLTIIFIGRIRESDIARLLELLTTQKEGDPSTTAIDNRLDNVPDRDSTANSFIASRATATTKETGNGYASLASVKPEDLANIRDDAASSPDEAACSLRLLDILNRTDPETIQKASVGPISYAQLFRQPNQYRGRLVTVAGVVRRVNPLDLPKNEYGIEKYYQIWLAPNDNRVSPIVIYCLHLPEGFPTGMDVSEEAEITGFFFKRWAYKAKDAIRTAPTILAATLEWQKRPVMTPER